MAKIYNSELHHEVQEAGKLQIIDRAPTELADKIVPVMEVNPRLTRFSKQFNITGSLSNQTSQVAYVCKSDVNTYLTNATLSVAKDATSTATLIELRVKNDDGVTVPLLRVTGFTLTALNQCITMNINPPIKVENGSSITLTSDTNIANVSARCSLAGFEIENSKA